LPLATAPTDAGSSPDAYIVGGLVASGALLIGYVLLRAMRRNQWPDIGDVVLLTATTTAVTAGIRLAVVAVTADSLGPFHAEDRVFIPLAGVALVLVSVHEIYKVFRDRATSPP
jgi:hypothetical protein